MCDNSYSPHYAALFPHTEVKSYLSFFVAFALLFFLQLEHTVLFT